MMVKMNDNPKPDPTLQRHVRRFDPMPSQGHYRGACRCGWHIKTPAPNHRTPQAAMEHMEKQFCDHIPLGERETHLLVNEFPGQEEVVALPIGRVVNMKEYSIVDQIYYGLIDTGLILPIVEFRLSDGRVLKTE
jgi:hypothetical protein